MEVSVWVWVAGVLGVIVVGIGLGYLIYYLFWGNGRYSSKLTGVGVKMKSISPQIPVDKEIESGSAPVLEQLVEEDIEGVEHEVSAEQTIPVRFAYTLDSKFNHPFERVGTIVCVNNALADGDEVRDTEDRAMKFCVIAPQGETDCTQYVLVEEGGQYRIPVIVLKAYVQEKVKLG